MSTANAIVLAEWVIPLQVFFGSVFCVTTTGWQYVTILAVMSLQRFMIVP